MYTVPTGDLKNIKCEMTLFKGEIVFQADGTPVTVTDAHAPSSVRAAGSGTGSAEKR
jgi:hypothetical protein